MDVFSFLVIISGAANLFLGYLVFSRGAKNKISFSLASCAILSGIWALSLYLYHFQILFSSLVWIKIVYLIVFIVVFNLFYFSLIFPYRARRSILFPIISYLIFSIPLLYILFFTKLWIKDVVYKTWGPETILGPAYIPVCTFWGFFGMWTLYNFFREYFISAGINRERVKYIFIGMCFFILIVVTVDGIIPLLTGSTQYFRISPLSSLFFVGFTAYAILRYRLMDVRLVVGRGVVYFFTLATLIGLGFLLMFLNSKLAVPLSTNVVGPLAMTIGIILFQSVFRFFEGLASKWFYYTFYSYQTVLTDLGRGLTRFLDLDQLSSLIVSTLMNTMKLDRTVVLLREPGDGEYIIQRNIGFKEENGISLVKDNFLTIWLEKAQKPLVYEEISLIIRDTTGKEERERLERLQGNMKRIEAALCLPLFIEEKIVGMIVLGNKLSGEPYSTQDIELLTNLANQASIALQNAKLYSEVKGFSKKLEKEVEKATVELREAYEELKKLDKAKSEFISIASHQLRTPLTAVKGYISMMLEKTYGAPPEQMEKPLKNIYLSNERLIKLVNDLLSVSRIEAGRMEIQIEKTSLEEIITSVVEELKNAAKEKNIYLKWEKPEKPLPKISVDKEKIRQAIMNVIDNAIRYTERGGVTIKCKMQNSKCKIEVKDTGTGLTKYELSKMFESFSRGAAGTRLYTEGVGLGLYVAKKFVEMHKGQIWAESKGKGKGSTFYIELPIK